MLTLGLLASHRGSNVQAAVEACRTGRLEARPGVIISNNANSGVLPPSLRTSCKLARAVREGQTPAPRRSRR